MFLTRLVHVFPLTFERCLFHRSVEREHIRKTIEIHKRLTGSRPLEFVAHGVGRIETEDGVAAITSQQQLFAVATSRGCA